MEKKRKKIEEWKWKLTANGNVLIIGLLPFLFPFLSSLLHTLCIIAWEIGVLPTGSCSPPS